MEISSLSLPASTLLRVVERSNAYHRYAKGQLEILKTMAIQIYISSEQSGPWRPSATSPPRYVKSFAIRGRGPSLRLVNTDPGWLWVEYGAHAGKANVEVLKYRVLARALDQMSQRRD